jgi:hypothetical protein
MHLKRCFFAKISNQTVAMPIQSKQDVLTRTLFRFYENPTTLRVLTDSLRTSTGSNAVKVSLRTLDWFVTNYAKRHRVVIPHNDRKVHVYLEYKGCLKAFSKKLFDPFQRRDRLVIQDADGEPLNTTIGQLNFFRWAIETGVLQYTASHIREIEADMTKVQTEKTSPIKAPPRATICIRVRRDKKLT